MTSERQIAANRRNAHNSSGPRSTGGKKRAAQNAYWHGLAAAIPLSRKFSDDVERLARKLTDGNDSPLAPAYARSAAEAFLELAEVRRVKIALIGSMVAFDEEDASSALDPLHADLTDFKDTSVAAPNMTAAPLSLPRPHQQSDSYAAALRRALPYLLKLNRYEKRAASRLARALRELDILRLQTGSKMTE
jgi:hypothetical protein